MNYPRHADAPGRTTEGEGFTDQAGGRSVQSLPTSPDTRPAPPTYKAVHHRLRAVLGPASAHLCADCDSMALDWSLEGPGEWIDSRGCRYSTNPADYAPRCRSCHIRFDRARREHVPGRHEVRRGSTGQLIPNTTLDAS